MRLPIASPLVSRDGAANKDARLTNMLKESDGSKELAVVRPGLELIAAGTGVGGGLVAFNGELVSVYGTTLGAGVIEAGPPSPYTVADMEWRGVADLGGAVWGFYGFNYASGNAEFYTGDSEGNLTLDSTGFEVDYPSNIISASPVAVSGTSVIVAKDQSLQLSAIGGSLSFSAKEAIAGARQYFSIKYLGGKFVAVSLNTATGQSTVRWSSDDGATWNSWNAPTTDTLVYDLAYNGSTWWIFCFDDATLEYMAFETVDFVTFTPQTFSGMNVIATGGGYSVAYGNGYFYTSVSEDAVEGVSYYSADGLAWGILPDLYVHFGESSTGVVFGVSATDIKTMTAGSGATLSSGFTAGYGFGANSGNSTLILYELSDTYDVVSLGGTIPALTTIQAGNYDFAQSPL